MGNKKEVIPDTGSNINEKTFAKFVEPRVFEDIDLVYITSEHLKVSVSASVSKRFLADSMIADVADSNSMAQRVIINRYFTKAFLSFRANNDVNITDMLVLLVNDGDYEDWFKIFRLVIAPFIKEHSVLGV